MDEGTSMLLILALIVAMTLALNAVISGIIF